MALEARSGSPALASPTRSRTPIPLPIPTRSPRPDAIGLLLLAGCGGGSPSTLDPHGAGAARVAHLWWILFWISAGVVAFVSALVVVGALRRRSGQPDPNTEPRWALRLVLWGGAIVPIFILTIVWVLTLRDLRAQSEPIGRSSLTVEVIGHRWWWEIRYPSLGIVTANDVHIPVGEPVTLRLQTIDVLHSFWVPQLAGKTDMISGRTTIMSLEADRPGVYRGQCAEYCGVQHANMIFFVVADRRADFDSWAANEAQPATDPADPLAERGREVFLEQPCTACHAVRGTEANAAIGPDLTHFAGRRTIGAGVAPNTRGYLAGWIEDSQTLKPGNLMPPVHLSADDLTALIAYLESLT
jgi:cytochrome c oxidase subunit 2